MTAPDVTPVSIWCSAPHPIADLVICKKLRHSPTVLHNSRNVPDWAETVRVSPPTTSNEETSPTARATAPEDGEGASLRDVGGTSG